MRFLNSRAFPAVSAILFILYLTALTPACTKSDIIQPADTTSHSEGTFYIKVLHPSGSYRFDKVDAQTGFTGWEIPITDFFGSFSCPVDYSEGMLYHGNFNTVSGYNTVTSEVQWSAGWLATNNISGARVFAFKDSLAFFTSASSAGSTSNAYCVNKFSGNIVWQQKIDAVGWTYSGFSPIPVVAENNVIMQTRDINAHKQLSAFRPADGKLVWQSTVNDLLLANLKVYNSKIYATGGGFIYCYNAIDGNLLWKTDIQYNDPTRTYIFDDDSKLVLAADGKPVILLDKNSGALLSSFNLPQPIINLMGFLYQDHVLYVSDEPTDKEFQIRAIDITTKKQTWLFRYTTNHFSSDTPIITDKYLIVPLSTTDSADANNNILKMVFVDFSGKSVREFSFLGYATNGFIYVTPGKTYRQ